MDLQVIWLGDKRFSATTPSGIEVSVDGDKATGPAPMEALQIAIAGCMGIDIVDILTKGRQELTGCAMRISGTRREDPPRRFTSIHLAFELTGRDLNRKKAERAVQLSRDTYCSVWRSMAPDIELTVDLDLKGA